MTWSPIQGHPHSEMNGNKKKWFIRKRELSTGSWNFAECQMTRLFHDAGSATANS